MSISETHLARAIAAHQGGRLKEAADEYEAALRERPDDPDALHFYGLLHFHHGRGIDAVKLIGRSLDLFPGNPHAWNNLGNILLIQNKISEAREAYRRVTLLAPKMAEAWFNLGILLRDTGEFVEAVKHLQAAIMQQPAFTRAYESLGKILYRIGDFAQAAEVYSAWLKQEPDNPVARHMAAATSGINVPERADANFIANLYDNYAAHFDANLEALGYRAPELLAATLASHLGERAGKVEILDAGCGTGLCGPLLRPLAARLTGVDLSEKMVERAQARGSYDELVVSELCEYLQSRPSCFDVVHAADIYEYFGSLEAVHAGTRHALRPGGLYLFTVEALPESVDADYKLEVHGRYAHHRRYLQASLERTGFEILEIKTEVLRTERLEDVRGFLAVARAV